MDGRNGFLEEIKSSPKLIRKFISKPFRAISENTDFENAARGNMPRGLSLERQNSIMGQIKSGFGEDVRNLK